MKSTLATHVSRIALAAVVVASAALLATPAHPAEPEYTFFPFDVPSELGAFTSAFGINNERVIVGNFGSVDETIHGFVFEKGQFTSVTVPSSGFDRGSLLGVNDQGTAVGTFDDAQPPTGHAYVRSRDGEITVLPDAAPDAVKTIATGINNPGTIVGFYFRADGVRHGFILRDGEYTTYDYPGAVRTILDGINDHGVIVGRYRDTRSHGFLLLTDGRTVPLDVPGAVQTFTFSGDINNLDQVVGSYQDEKGIVHGFLFRDGAYITLDFPGAANTNLLSINDHGEIVGTHDNASFGLVALPTR